MLIYLQMIETPEDKEKFEILYLEYKGLMYHVAYSILNNDQDAEDAVHNAFVKIAENIKQVAEPVSMTTRAYVVTIAERKAIDTYRMRKRHPEVPLDEAFIGLPVVYNGNMGLAKCVAKLPPRYRHVLDLKYRYGYTNREVAKLMELTESNAIKLDQRAKHRLRDLCIKEGIL